MRMQRRDIEPRSVGFGADVRFGAGKPKAEKLNAEHMFSALPR